MILPLKISNHLAKQVCQVLVGILSLVQVDLFLTVFEDLAEMVLDVRLAVLLCVNQSANLLGLVGSFMSGALHGLPNAGDLSTVALFSILQLVA